MKGLCALSVNACHRSNCELQPHPMKYLDLCALPKGAMVTLRSPTREFSARAEAICLLGHFLETVTDFEDGRPLEVEQPWDEAYFDKLSWGVKYGLPPLLEYPAE